MLYYSWSQGFRAGGFNRGFLSPQNSPLTPGDARASKFFSLLAASARPALVLHERFAIIWTTKPPGTS